MRVDILSERKGSNPGGVCQAHDNGFSIRGYFKYCHGSRIAGKSSFVPQHQPIYEAMTFEMARRLGLDTVDYFVLLNEGSRVSRRSRDIQFSGWKDYNFSHNPSGRLFYFMSKMESAPEDVDSILKWYARYELGTEILESITKHGQCVFEAEC